MVDRVWVCNKIVVKEKIRIDYKIEENLRDWKCYKKDWENKCLEIRKIKIITKRNLVTPLK